jgi:MSHA biogenesis protein MshL
MADNFYPETKIINSTPKHHQPPAMVTDALIPDFNQTISAAKSVPLTFNISVNEVHAREFFMGLVIDTEINMLVHPDVSGKIALELKNVTLIQTLDAVQKVYGYEYQKTDFGYIIYPATLQTKIFKINYLDIVREGRSQTRVSSGQISASNDQSNSYNSGSAPQTNNNSKTETSGSSISTISETNFWALPKNWFR